MQSSSDPLSVFRLKHGLPEPLDGSNYHLWAPQVVDALTIENFADALEDEKAKQSSKALAMLRMSVAPSIRAMLQGCTSAKEAWDLLKGKYATRCSGKVLTWLRALHTIDMDSVDTMEAYIARILELISNLEAAGFKQDDKAVILALLAGLPQLYGPLKDRVMSQMLDADSPSLEKVIDEAIIYQGRADIINPETKTAFFAGKIRCKYCKKLGHTVNKCFKLKNKQQDDEQQVSNGQQGEQQGSKGKAGEFAFLL